MNNETSTFWADIKRYEDILSKDPNSYCFTILSELYRKLGLFDDAINTAAQGIEIHPDYIGGHMALGRAYYDKGQTEESKNALEHVVKVTPDNLLAQKLLIQIYIQEGNLSKATKTVELIELLNPGDMESRQMLEIIKKNSFKIDTLNDTENVFSEQVDLGEVSDFGKNKHVIVNSQSKEGSELASDYEFSISDKEDTPPLATATLAELYVEQGYINKAIEVYRELFEKFPERIEYVKRFEELQRILDVETWSKDREKNPEDNINEMNCEPLSLNNGISENYSLHDNEKRILSIFENWLVNIDRGRYAA